MNRSSLWLVWLALPLSLPAQIPLNPTPTLALGQPPDRSPAETRSLGPNLLEGRELNGPTSVAYDATTGALYVADSGNNRVLGWRDGRSFANGAKADLVIGQWNFHTNLAFGATLPFTSGLNSPTGLAVDARGNLYVVDSGNNRILRFKRPFDSTEDPIRADLVIGQSSLSGSGAGTAAERIRTTGANNVPLQAGLAFDAQGNLWFTDAGNNRVLRFPASSLGETASNGPPADVLLGQTAYDQRTAPARNDANRRNKTVLLEPSALAFDSRGRLFVADGLNRVVVWEPEITSGKPASRILGVPAAGGPAINAASLGLIRGGQLLSPDGILLNIAGTQWFPPSGVFAIGNIPFVVDTYANRILRYRPFDEWPAESVAFSPNAEAVIGQDALETDDPRVNRGRPQPSEASLAWPRGAIYSPQAGLVYVADTGNNRVLAFPNLSSGPPASSGSPYAALRLLGQVGYDLRERNLLEGKEFQFISAYSEAIGGIAIDRNSDPPRLYIADTYNNRILCFADARRIRPGDVADRVIGQPNLRSSMVNWPIGRSDARNEVGLFWPTGLALDAGGNLYVADRGNGRVLRFRRPFDQPAGAIVADLVLGQANFGRRDIDPSASTMGEPYGLAFTGQGWLAVSDRAFNRVLLFEGPEFRNGQAAVKVFGQSDFISISAGGGATGLNAPRDIAIDGDDRLYVADGGNRRIQIFPQQITSAETRSGAPAVLTLGNFGASSPRGIHVNPLTGEIWAAEPNNNTTLCGAARPCLVRYPRFDILQTQGISFERIGYSTPPLALAQDGLGNVYAADSLSRVLIHFPRMAASNTANGLEQSAPNTYTSIYTTFDLPGVPTAVFDALPMPTTLADIQVLVNQRPVPIHFLSPRQINFLMPGGAPEEGAVEVWVMRSSTRQILAAGSLRMDVVSPGLLVTERFTVGNNTFFQVAALNVDAQGNRTLNWRAATRVGDLDARPARVGEVVEIFATGFGRRVPGAPADGEPAPGALPTDLKPRVFLNSRWLDDADILYSGLAPGLISVWQINIRIPDFVPPGNNLILVTFYDRDSRRSGNPDNPQRLNTTIAIQR